MRAWFVIPAMAGACGAAAFALGLTPVVALTGAGLAAMVRVLAGDSPAALTGAVLAPVLAVASFAEAGSELSRAALALAAAGWAVTELARRPGSPLPLRFPSPAVAVLAAAVAAVLDPSFVALVAIAGSSVAHRVPSSRGAFDPCAAMRGYADRKAISGPSVAQLEPRPRWAVGVAVAGLVALALAVVAGTAWPALGAWWYGVPAQPATLRSFAALAGTTLGPITCVAALAGIASLARARTAELAVAAVLASAVLVDLRAGALGASTIGLAALLSGLAIARLSAMIRIPSAQALAGAAIGVLIVMPPAWTAFEQRSPVAHTGHASR